MYLLNINLNNIYLKHISKIYLFNIYIRIKIIKDLNLSDIKKKPTKIDNIFIVSKTNQIICMSLDT